MATIDPTSAADDVISTRAKRLQPVQMEFLAASATMEVANELTRIRFELGAIRQLLETIAAK